MSSSSPARLDPEKGPLSPLTISKDTPEVHSGDVTAKNPSKVSSFIVRLRSHFPGLEKPLGHYNIEARGIQRVEAHETQPLTRKSYLQCFTLWISINLAAVNVTLGMLAPTVYGLGFKDAALCAAFGSLLGSIPVAYVATRGPVSGNRSLVR